MSGAGPLCLLLLDGVLEEGAFAARGQDLLRAPSVVAIEPARRAPGFLVDGVARRLVRRLPGEPRVLVLLGDAQRGLARALLARHPGCELWHGTAAPPLEGAALAFDPATPPGATPLAANGPLWDRLEALGVARR